MELDEELVVLPDVPLEEFADVADVLPEELVGSPGPRVHATIVVTPKKTPAARDRGATDLRDRRDATESFVAPQNGQRRSLNRT